MAKEGDLIFEPVQDPGPTAIGRGLFDEQAKIKSCAIVARYTKVGVPVKVRVRSLSGDYTQEITASSLPEQEIVRLRV